MSKIDKTNSIEINSGEFIEICFPEEQVEYKFTVSTRQFKMFNDCIVLDIPYQLKDSFYKGEDFIQCRCIKNNTVYEFCADIVRLVLDDKPCVIIRKSSDLIRSNTLAEKRVATNILCEYSLMQLAPGSQFSRNNGFAIIKDANGKGISFLTIDTLPIGAIVKMNFVKATISIEVEIKRCQLIDDKYSYGAKIQSFCGNSSVSYLDFINSVGREYTEENIGYKLT